MCLACAQQESGRLGLLTSFVQTTGFGYENAAGSTDILRPHHFFSSFVTGGSEVRSTQMSGVSAAGRAEQPC